MTTKNDKQHIHIDSFLTKNIIIPIEYPDGQKGYEANVYGEQAAFIAQATLIDAEQKKLGYLRFESKPFVIASKIEYLSQDWHAFDKKVEEYCNNNVEVFKNQMLPPVKVIIV